MKVSVGPVAPTSAEAWISWARDMICEMRTRPRSTDKLPAQVLDDVGRYVDSWAGRARHAEVFQWQDDVEVDELEYLTNALYNLDDEASGTPERAAPAEGRAFHVVLVQALLFALAQAGPSRAAFVEQLRPAWPVALAVH